MFIFRGVLRRVGMSKERRVDPQVLVGMLVTTDGFPLEVHELPGSTGETLTLLPVLRAFHDPSACGKRSALVGSSSTISRERRSSRRPQPWF